MEIFLFIVLLLTTAFIRVLPPTLSNYGKKERNINFVWLALILGIGFMFINPLLLNWFLDFLFGFKFDYWIAFMFIFVIDVFTYTNENYKEGE